MQVLRDTGVGGLRFASQVKCLHAHLAHALSGADNPIGRRVIDALAKGADAKAGKGETDGDEHVAKQEQIGQETQLPKPRRLRVQEAVLPFFLMRRHLQSR